MNHESPLNPCYSAPAATGFAFSRIEFPRHECYNRKDLKQIKPSENVRKCRNGDLEKSLHMLSWVNSHIRHKGNYDNSDTQDALTLLGAAFDKNYGINCLAMSIVLCECLLALRVRARVMYMMPKNAQDGDNHVVVEAYVPDKNKWIMLDPTYGSYCLNSEGEILNLYEIRNCIAQDTEYYFSASMNYNGNPVDDDVHKRMTDNLRFRIDVCGNLEIFHIRMQYEENLGNVYIDPLSIY